MAKRSRVEIMRDKIKMLEQKKEESINKYILPIEQKIANENEKIKEYYRKKGIHLR